MAWGVQVGAGGVRVKPGGVVVAQTGDPCCCGGDPGNCTIIYRASLICDENTGEATGWNIYLPTGPTPGYGTSWYDTSPGVFCSDKAVYITYPCEQEPPDPPAAPPLPSYQCRQCFDITVSEIGWSRTWHSGAPCPLTPLSYPAEAIRVRFDICGSEMGAGDLIDGEILTSGFSDWISERFRFQYDPTTDTIHIHIYWRLAGDMELVDSTCNPPEVHWNYCSITVSGTATAPAYAFVHVRRDQALVVGAYSPCLGRTITAEDTGEHQAFREIYATISKSVCIDTDKFCYYYKTATCTEVSPGVWIWIPGSMSAQCLDADPAGLDTWTLVSGRTYQIIRKGANCNDASSCTSFTMETPAGVIACP